VTHTRCCIDTIVSPDDEHEVARNMLRIEINIQKKEFLPDLHIRSPTQSDTQATKCIDTIDSPDDEHEVARNM
jgi:hypothetical protein